MGNTTEVRVFGKRSFRSDKKVGELHMQKKLLHFVPLKHWR